MLDHITESISECGLHMKDMVQLGMDGPSVNWKLYENLSQKLQQEYGTSLINIGSCGLHVVHNSFKRGIASTEWKVSSFLSSLYYLLKDAPARLEDYIHASDSSLKLLKFVSQRWLKNVPVCQRAICIYDNVIKFVDAAESKKVPKPQCKSYEVIAECTKDECFLAKLYFFKCVAEHLQPFLLQFQTDRPMVPFMAPSMNKLLRGLMRRFIKKEKLECSDDQLCKIDVTNTEFHMNYTKIDIGFASEKLTAGSGKKKPSERMQMQFRMECKACLIAVLSKLIEKSPVSYSIVRHLSCLSPSLMVSGKDLCYGKFKKVLSFLVNCNWLNQDDCDTVLQEFTMLLDAIPKDRFKAFNPSEDRLDTLLIEYVAADTYKHLRNVLKIILVLSHGQSTVERGFSTNKEVEVENMKEKTLVAQRIICDHINNVGGLQHVPLTKELLLSCKMSRQRYTQHLEDERTKRKSASEIEKRKTTMDALEELKKKKRRLENDVDHLQKSADQLYDKAEDSGKIRFVTQANAMKRTAKDKKSELEDLEKDLKAKVKELTGY